MSKYLLVSVTLHTVLLLTFVRFIFWQTDDTYIDLPIINTYILNKYQSKLTTNISTKITARKHNPSSPRASMQTSHIDQLKIIIYNLIQNRLKYPQNIRISTKPKIIIASLIVFPDGHIEKPKIIKSSGMNIFDRKTLETISSITYIQEAISVVQEPILLEIPIEFLQNSLQ